MDAQNIRYGILISYRSKISKRNYIDYEIVAPTTVKKFASGSGNATKEKMYEAFVEENPRRDIKDVLTPRSSNIISPLNDVVDSYFILKYGI